MKVLAITREAFAQGPDVLLLAIDRLAQIGCHNPVISACRDNSPQHKPGSETCFVHLTSDNVPVNPVNAALYAAVEEADATD